MNCYQFDEFCEQHTDDFIVELLEEITEAYLAKTDTNRVCIHNIHKHNAINATIEGSVTIGEESYDFIMDSGDWNGTEIKGWGSCEPYEPPKPTIYTMVPVNPNLEQQSPALWSAYLAWKEQDWFKELIRSYMYDKHFAPGSKTESHYRDKAAQRGLRLEVIEEKQHGAR